jgi:dihydrofolate reductase
MVMSVDGYVSDRNGDLSRLYPDFQAMVESAAVQEAMQATGAMVMGRRSYDMGNGDFTGYEFQVPIFVVTHNVPPQPARGQNDQLSFTFVIEGVARAIELAKSAAGSRDVTIVGGPDTIRQALAAGLVDELHLDIRAVLLHDGLSLFEPSDGSPVELAIIDVTGSPGITHIRYRVCP